VRNAAGLLSFMRKVLPESLPKNGTQDQGPTTATELIEDVKHGIQRAPMAVKLTPHILSLIDWSNPLSDPLMRQFIPLASRMLPDHPKLTFDSLDETGDSPVKGIIHRYPDKAVFLGITRLLSTLQGIANNLYRSHLCVSCILPLLHTVVYRGNGYSGREQD